MVQQLDQRIENEIDAARNTGYEEQTKGNFEAAEIHYLRAWDLFPEPKYEWPSSMITLYKIGKFYQNWGKYEKATEWVEKVFNVDLLPGDPGPYVVLGSIAYDAGKLENAFQHFQKAYAIAGKRGFQRIDKKYFEFFRKRTGDNK